MKRNLHEAEIVAQRAAIGRMMNTKWVTSSAGVRVVGTCPNGGPPFEKFFPASSAAAAVFMADQFSEDLLHELNRARSIVCLYTMCQRAGVCTPIGDRLKSPRAYVTADDGQPLAVLFVKDEAEARELFGACFPECVPFTVKMQPSLSDRLGSVGDMIEAIVGI